MSGDSRESQEEERGQEQLNGQGAIEFKWGTRWLKGHEYLHILKNMEEYCMRFDFQAHPYKTHPLQIYESPRNGKIYFVAGEGVGSQFGFPRVASKKKYRWKKMNFTTNLPKKNSCVTYVVASAMRAHPIEKNDDSEYRMHAVVPFNPLSSPTHILCHIRKVGHRRDHSTNTLSSCFLPKGVDFYKLFSLLHNRLQE